MESGDISLNLVWLDDAFAKDWVDELEAACCLTEGQDKLLLSDTTYSYHMQMYPNLQRNFNIVVGWNLHSGSLLSFIEKAIEKNITNFRRKYLLKRCNNLYLNLPPNEKEKFVAAYYFISKELKLNVSPSSNNVDLPNVSSIPWKKNAERNNNNFWRKSAAHIYFELGLNKTDITVERKAKKVEEEMKKRHDAGEKGMTIRGGKKLPDAESILRLVITDL
jgi:hypothetical protein